MPVKIATLVDPARQRARAHGAAEGQSTTSRTRNDRDGRHPMIEQVARAAALLCVSGSVAAPANAHHSFAKFDRQRSIELEGELVEVKWQNPHVQFTLRSRGDDGQVQDLAARDELAGHFAPHRCRPRLVAVGDRVKVAGNPAVDGSLELNADEHAPADGREVSLGFGGAPRFAGRTIGDGRAWAVRRATRCAGARPVSRLGLDVRWRGPALQRSCATDAAPTNR